MVPKAGDSLTYKGNMLPAVSDYTMRYDYGSGTYQGQSAVASTVTTTMPGGASSTGGVIYLNPTTGTYLGSVDGSSTDNIVTTYDPPDYEYRLAQTVLNVGQVTSIAVKARLSGPGISNAFATIGGGTALTMDYTYSLERKPNESLTIAAGTFANVCKLQVSVTVKNVKLEGNNGSNPLFASMFDLLSGSMAYPFNLTLWLTNQLPNAPKSYMTTAVAGGGSAATELTSYTLTAR